MTANTNWAMAAPETAETRQQLERPRAKRVDRYAIGAANARKRHGLTNRFIRAKYERESNAGTI